MSHDAITDSVLDLLRRHDPEIADLRVSSEGQEGMRAFVDKRKPSWIP